MTTPVPPQQQAQPQPPAQPAPAAPAATIPPQTLAAMALPLAGLLLTAASAAAVVAVLKLRFKLSALFWLALLMVLNGIVMAHPPQATGMIGPAGAHVSRLNLARRAQYALAAASRVTGAMVAARSRGDGVLEAGREAVERERRFFQQHLDAMRKRSAAAMATDMAAMEHGPVLGWYAVIDTRTTRECRLANGKNYYAGQMPAIGFPGAVHLRCRCRPGPPHRGAPLLSSTGPKYNRRAAA